MLNGSEKAGIFEVVRTPAPVTFITRKWMIAGSKGTRIAAIIDGASKTVMVSEIMGVNSENDARGVWTFPGMGGSSFTGLQTPNSPNPDQLPICETAPNFYQGPSDPLRCTKEYTADGNAFATARSQHLGAVNVALADGSVHSISTDIDPKVWEELCTRHGPTQGVNMETNLGVPD